MQKSKQTGFTIVELLIVIVVIGILAALVLNAFSGAQGKARDTSRINTLKEVRTALEFYHADNGVYPLSANGSGQWAGHCPNYGNYDNYIVGLAPKYIQALPVDPRFDSTNQCFLYRSDGTDYSFISHMSAESICGGDPGNACNPTYIQAMDRPCHTQPTFSVYTEGGRCW